MSNNTPVLFFVFFSVAVQPQVTAVSLFLSYLRSVSTDIVFYLFRLFDCLTVAISGLDRLAKAVCTGAYVPHATLRHSCPASHRKVRAQFVSISFSWQRRRDASFLCTLYCPCESSVFVAVGVLLSVLVGVLGSGSTFPTES
jgi:hypothetical protein